MPVDIRTFPRTQFDELQITGISLSPDSRSKVLSETLPTVPTAAGTTEVLFIVPFDGIVTSVRYVFKDALAAHDTNFVTFAVLNKTQANANLLSAAASNTTKITGGAALVAYTQRTAVLASGGGVTVSKFDVLAAQVVGSGTLANTLTEGRVQINLLVAS